MTDNSKIQRIKGGLRLIEGGLPDKEDAEKEFVSAFVTDTRLMGEIAVGIHWRIPDHPEAEDLFQFFSGDQEHLFSHSFSFKRVVCVSELHPPLNFPVDPGKIILIHVYNYTILLTIIQD